MAGEGISNVLTSNPSRDPDNPPALKKKRSLPGTPDPEAEVIALSPKTLLATNRFLCEICGKGFQRDQNLQLHRRGHNLPWKLRQRSGKEPRKRVYVCPEKSCVHHNPSRALGDLTGIKKHFCRKHGEKKWKCDKCSKRYAVQSDWKAHAKVCGTREYRCDCGTLFSRRDSFITHRAFCDALAEEAARISAASTLSNPVSMANMMNYPCFSASIMRSNITQQPLPSCFKPAATGAEGAGELSLWMGQETSAASAMPFLSPYGASFLSSCPNAEQLDGQFSWIYSGSKLLATGLGGDDTVKESPSSLSSLPYLLPEHRRAPVADMSATGLLQKAAQMGVVSSSCPSLLAGLELKSNCTPPIDGHKFDSLAGNFLKERIEAGTGGGEITRDFLGVGYQALCPSYVNGWI
ncbi:hypothetical protein HPP92_008644 [Vanilla planifolia]|uniref:Protein EARLY HEADING DATE 2 n=1 Tax=Vanilla planifolia TaxID=51239 RepID=A0A835V2B3_VANPL|nr:hypothetical protein HPP92_008828 [Vanilla planifolia]KAG0486549.1 hypothetical protein HPP92_008644 [Vanilla planifolia]